MGKILKFRFEHGITAAYLIIGCLWILFSDYFVEGFTDDKEVLSKIQTYKGWFYVVFTGILFFLFLKGHLKRLRAAEAKAKESDRLKTAFLANVSHEVRTPMNAILGFSELLKNPELTGEQHKEYLDIIEKSGERMLLLINDIVAISKLDTGQITTYYTLTDVNELIEHLHSVYLPITDEKGLAFKISETAPKEKCKVYTDKEKLVSVLTHLLKNAIKYSADGTIEIGVSLEKGHYRFSVKDDGIGIPEERIENIFERFVQADIRLSRAHEGIGLGLSISKAYIEMLGGNITVESKEGLGSKFTFRIPVKENFD
ncbi:MAG: hypothetical protein CVU12_03485 [Bacteroidetes bacterium HGW-Bacteroidetes-7]|jgi:signal transduction histidine kinase|nr:MAG: hypothetical protein CVU12_03485 [Bacteroidetes bacterium HGW-Bacteroidetes-7]